MSIRLLLPGLFLLSWICLCVAAPASSPVDAKDIALPNAPANAATARFSWMLKALPAVAIAPGEAIEVSIAVGPVPATGATVFHSGLVEKATKTSLSPHGLRLCPTADGDCGASPLNLVPNSSNQLWLRGITGIGIYEGSVTIAAAEKPEGDSVSMTVYSTTWIHRAFGVLTLFLGVVLTWACTVLVRNAINRDQLLLPVALARKTLAELKAIQSAGAKVLRADEIGKCIDRIQEELSLDNLAASGLPSRVPWFGSPTSAPSIEGYRRYVQAASDWVQVLRMLVREGLEPAWKQYEASTADPARADAARAAVIAIDNLAKGTTAPPVESVRQSLSGILATMSQVAGAKAAFNAAAPAADQVKLPEQLQLEISRLGMLGWAFVMLVTTLSGAYLFVLGPSSQGFGTAADFLQCLLWGVGLPVGTQLMSSTTGSIATTLGVTR